MRDALATLLNETGKFEIVGSVGSVDEALEILERADPSVIVLDMSMRGRPGLDLLAALHGRHARARVLVLSMHSSEEYVVSALNAGATGYVCKDAPSAQVIKGLHTVAAGRMFLSVEGIDSPPISSICGREPTDDTVLAQLTITARERAVLRVLALGHGNKRIARDLGISIKTVEKHRSNLMRKLGLHNAAGLTLFAARQGIVSTWENVQSGANGRAREPLEGLLQRAAVPAA